MDWHKHRLAVFGCSFTYGHGLPDCIGPDFTGPGEQPSKMGWPNHLKTRLQFTGLDNMAVPGASNKMIADEIVNYEIKEPTVAVILWSNFERKTIFKEELTKKNKKRLYPGADSPRLHMMPMFIHKDHMPDSFWKGFDKKGKDKFSNLIQTYYEDYHYDYDCVYENCILINYVHSFLESKGVKSFHLINYHLINEHKKVFNDLKINSLQAKTFRHMRDFHIDDGLDKQRYTKPHPGVKSQIHFTNFIEKWMKQCR
tara:strand:- start:731 stop:1495 length:765 start_codon:yes stop_codon:yes gene_type:complete